MVDTADRRLFRVKLLHTIVWAFFAGCIVAIPVVAWRGELRAAVILCAIVFVEVVILALNGGRCPLTPIAARFTENRRSNFDIFLPEFVARYNKQIFGTLYVAGLVLVVIRWLGQ